MLLSSGDSLKVTLARHAGAGGDEVDTTELLFNIRAFVAGEGAVAAAQPVMAAPEPAAARCCTPPHLQQLVRWGRCHNRGTDFGSAGG